MSDIFSSDVTVEAGASPLPVSGTVTVVQPTGTNLHTVIDSGTVTTTAVVSSTSNITQVTPAANTNTQLIAANVNRKKIILSFPKGGATTWIKFGVTASATSFTYAITTSNTTIIETTWQGEIDYIGVAQTVTITELV